MLDELAHRHCTDKGSWAHGYARHYERFLEHRHFEAVRLLEIGVAHGASLKMWRDYFPNASIVGMDNNPGCAALSIFGVDVVIGDQRDAATLSDLSEKFGPFDIVIDDGSHYWPDQIFSFQQLWPRLALGGCYCIEDLATSYRPGYAAGSASNSTITVLKYLVDAANLHGKSLWADPKNDPAFRSFDLNHLERSIDSIHFSSGLAIIEKRKELL